MVTKSIIGALSAHNAMNYYLDSQLDAGDNTSNNYTTMEHKWDEAFGYSIDPTDNILLNKYAKKVDNIGDKLMNAFIRGRRAIADKNYPLRDKHASIIKSL